MEAKELELLKKERELQLENKRKKLEELKKMKQDRQTKEAAKSSPSIPSTEPRMSAENLDNLVSSLLAQPVAPLAQQPVAAAAVAPHKPVAVAAVQNFVVQTHAAEINIPPKIVENYTKTTQTDDSAENEEENTTANLLPPSPTAAKRHFRSPSVDITDGFVKELPVPVEHKPKELSPDERKHILSSTDFADFFQKSTRLVERALGQEFDVLADFTDIEGDEEGRRRGQGDSLSVHGHYYEEKWCKGRAVTDVAWSPKHPELLLASYSAKDDAAVTDPDGLVLLWSLSMRQRPEFVFTCQSAVTAACFHKYSPHLLIGGTYSGQIVLWDTRGKSGPVQRTPLSSKGHSHPVYSLAMVGTQNAHNLVSVSNDGRLCVWSLSMLVNPQEYLDLKHKTRDVAVTCLTFSEGETNQFYVGSEDGSIFQGYIHGNKVGVTEALEGHQGPVTSLHVHPSTPSDQYAADFSDLLLSTSVDWTCKLWSQKHSHSPLYSFESAEDYAYDARWSPAHPSVFASVNGEGHVDMWDLNRDLEAPVARSSSQSRAYNRIRWALDGRKLATGDSAGSLTVWDVDKAFYTPRAEEWSRLDQNMADLRPDTVAFPSTPVMGVERTISSRDVTTS
eukprot:GILJ01005383.1.p1 GENE.GILJ01005383.1~~GILJ01005383.1.p1  ORF type:complete len:644 (-),score=93.54 GILJ01005383.1:168-2021(-)